MEMWTGVLLKHSPLQLSCKRGKELDFLGKMSREEPSPNAMQSYGTKLLVMNSTTSMASIQTLKEALFLLSILYSVNKLYWGSNMANPVIILTLSLSGKHNSETLQMGPRLWSTISLSMEKASGTCTQVLYWHYLTGKMDKAPNTLQGELNVSSKWLILTSVQSTLKIAYRRWTFKSATSKWCSPQLLLTTSTFSDVNSIVTSASHSSSSSARNCCAILNVLPKWTVCWIKPNSCLLLTMKTSFSQRK